jgi:hypothetical protein
VTKDTVPRWLRPVEPGYSANCRVEVDPAPCANEETARSLEECVKHIEREVTVFVASRYPATLAAEILREKKDNPRVLIRAATAEEVLARYAGALAGGPRVMSRRIEWQEHSAGEMVSDPVAVLWTGEVVFNRGPGGMISPFYVLEAVAEAWAFGSALHLRAMDVCSAQVVCWHCAPSLAAQVIEKGDDEFDRLRGYFVSPIRLHESLPVWLPGMILENNIRGKVG